MAISSLADTLKSQNDQLVDISKGIGQMNSSFSKMLDADKLQRLKDLETERDAKAAQTAVKTAVKGASSGGGQAGGGKGGKGGGTSLLKKLGIGAAGLGIGSMFSGKGKGGGMLGKAGIFGVSQLMADSIGQQISNMTGDEDLGAAAANMTKFAGIGSLFGKRFALLGGVAGAFATPENIQTLKDIGNSLSEVGAPMVAAASENLAKLATALPSLSDTYKYLSVSSNEVLRSIDAIINTDVKGMTENITGVTALAGLAGGRNLAKGIKNRNNPKIPETKLSKGARVVTNNKTAQNLSKKQLAKLATKGITVGKGGMKMNNKFMSADKMDSALKSVKAPTSSQAKGVMNALKKYKRFGKALKLPIIGPLISAGSIGLILANPDLTAKEKTAQIGVALASISGGILGTAAGALFGSLGGPVGAGLGGLAGGILGAFSGDYLAGEIAKFLMGGDSEIVGMAKDISAAGGGGLSTAAGGPSFSDIPNTPPAKVLNSSGTVIKDASTTSESLKLSGGGAAVFAPVQSSTNNNSSNTNLVGSILSTTDFNDLAGTRTA